MKFPFRLFSALFISICIPIAHTTSLTTQNPLFERIDDLISKKPQDSNVLAPPRIDFQPTSLLSTASETSVGQNAAAGGGDQGNSLFPPNFQVTPGDQDPDLLGDVGDKTRAAEQAAEQNPQENRLMNQEAQTPATTPPTEAALPPPQPEFGLNPDLNPELSPFIDAIREGVPASALPSPAEAAAAKPFIPPAPITRVGPLGVPTSRVNDISVQLPDDNVMFGREEPPLGKWSAGYTIVLCIVLMALLIIVVYLRNLFNKYFNPVLLKRVSHASRDVLTFLVLATIILWLNYLGVDIWDIPINQILLAFSVFALSWLLWSVILIIYGQSYSVNWEEKEIQGKFRDRILKEYRELYDKAARGETFTSEEQKLYKQYYSQLKYSLLRQNFISPSYLPVTTESFLRDDFNFAGYLTLCLEKVFLTLFRMSLATLITVLLIVFYWIEIVQIGKISVESICFGIVVPVLSFVFLVILKRKFSNIDIALRTPLNDPHKIEFIKNDNQKDAWANLHNPLPPYIEKPEEDFQQSVKLFKGQRRPNLQESQFWRGSPLFSVTVLHVLAVCQIIWATLYYGYFMPENDLILNLLFSTFVTILFLINLFYMIPSTLILYAVVSNVEMKKDRDLVRLVIADQRNILRQALIKLYRLLKSARREFSEEESPGIHLRDFTVKMIKESFRKIKADSWEIDIQDLPRLAHLCGSKLDKDELVYLARGSSQDLETIFIDDFIETIEKMTKDVKLDPYETSNEVLRSLAVRDDDFFVLKEFKELLVNHKVLLKPDIEEILHELRYLSVDNLEVEVPSISSLIRNSIEGHPR